MAASFTSNVYRINNNQLETPVASYPFISDSVQIFAAEYPSNQRFSSSINGMVQLNSDKPVPTQYFVSDTLAQLTTKITA